jgi:hypothetical protein
MDGIDSTIYRTATNQHAWSRDEIAFLVEQIRLDQSQRMSLNQAASMHNVPRSTAENWLRSRCRLEQQADLPSATVEFFRITPRACAPPSPVVRLSSGRGTSRRWRDPQYLLAA